MAPRPALVRAAAARFAGKEAVLKVIGCGIGPAALREVEILAPGRKPQVRLSGNARLAALRGIDGIEVSLTHDPPFAAAIAVAYGRQERGGQELEKED